MTREGEEARPEVVDASAREAPLEVLDKRGLEARFQSLIASLDSAGEANDAQRCLLLAIQTHRIELEIQGRELSKTQRALEISRDHYARLFDEAPVGYILFSRRGLIRAINLTAATLLERSRAEIEGYPFRRFVVADEVRSFIAHLRRVFDETESSASPRNLVLHLSNGSWVRVMRLCSIRRDGLLGPECFTVLLDITTEHEAEHQRLASDRLRQSVLDALPSQIAVLDKYARVVAVNRAWREFSERQAVRDAIRDGLGLNTRAVCHLSDDFPSEAVRAAAMGIQEVIHRQRPVFSLEYPCHTPQRKRWFLMRVFPLEGEQEGAVVAYLDITERHLAEEEARRARDALAQVARLNAVGILASSLIHELVQPLSSAGFYCSAASQLAQGPAANPGRLVDVIQRIDDQVHRAGDIMERLRTFLRGRTMNKVRIPADQVLKRAHELVLWFASDRKVTLEIRTPETLPDIETDPVQIEQVLVNLICNAVQAIDSAGSSRREVVLEVVQRANEIELIVRDTGPGLPADRHAAIFDIFESTNDSGLGLGLAISRAIAEAHGGRLWAEPAPSEGAAFHLTLPIAWDDEGLEGAG
ncbi:PAS domain-containing sensor histidine kinase [Thiocystis violacea]|uniref:PAS domain-containing sensor histidine kinase n=1 Tax=Thiocystis violacea TaxID=13725 RepID=UPI001906E04A|nr:ATP-binding protein [Thiocystis violacea]MBK1720147.1 histidine kinase [Thiocystis violacea]